ncbi:MAG: hypothetical protein PHO67_07995 [Candidatus Omnitrophica bacterium]|nr:hypothetical protein [Candidatus Omnitrophota bacterium]
MLKKLICMIFGCVYVKEYWEVDKEALATLKDMMSCDSIKCPMPYKLVVLPLTQCPRCGKSLITEK